MSFLCIFSSLQVYIHMCTGECVCLCTWRSEVKAGCSSGVLPFYLFIFFKDRSLTAKSPTDRLLWLPASPAMVYLCLSQGGDDSMLIHPRCLHIDSADQRQVSILSRSAFCWPSCLPARGYFSTLKELPFENEIVRWITNTIKHKATNILAISRHSLLIFNTPLFEMSLGR